MGSTMEEIMRKRQKEAADAYEQQWNNGLGSHHPDYDPDVSGPEVVKATRETEELYNAIVSEAPRVFHSATEGHHMRA